MSAVVVGIPQSETEISCQSLTLNLRSGKMEWQKIDVNKLPKEEILCANFKRGTRGYKEKMIGYASKFINGKIQCSNETETLIDVTHFIDINKFDVED